MCSAVLGAAFKCSRRTLAVLKYTTSCRVLSSAGTRYFLEKHEVWGELGKHKLQLKGNNTSLLQSDYKTACFPPTTEKSLKNKMNSTETFKQRSLLLSTRHRMNLAQNSSWDTEKLRSKGSSYSANQSSTPQILLVHLKDSSWVSAHLCLPIWSFLLGSHTFVSFSASPPPSIINISSPTTTSLSHFPLQSCLQNCICYGLLTKTVPEMDRISLDIGTAS